MLSLLQRQIAIQAPRNSRFLSEAVDASSSLASTSASSPLPASTSTPSSPSAKTAATNLKLEYFVPRNTNGNLPVYTDVRNAGSRHLVLIRNVEGNLNALAKDLSQSLFEAESYEVSRLKIQFNQSKHLIISGGRWKDEVTHWLKNKGF
ncbi:hypothetical protein BDN70DRAFT_873217 [Pholiota conissans]|uniref:Large ribosomal subunit protein mL49 n=1 Tax=Pholiota conissans TaxID=109636 RepID=A0A9P6D5A2_9AGAR|nr:hypothetical protein BDN70DRAFT_873217 [Pholiota conissans]